MHSTVYYTLIFNACRMSYNKSKTMTFLNKMVRGFCAERTFLLPRKDFPVDFSELGSCYTLGMAPVRMVMRISTVRERYR